MNNEMTQEQAIAKLTAAFGREVSVWRQMYSYAPTEYAIYIHSARNSGIDSCYITQGSDLAATVDQALDEFEQWEHDSRPMPVRQPAFAPCAKCASENPSVIDKCTCGEGV